MHLVDTSVFYAPEGGGVSRYLDVKHEWLRRHARWQHTILALGPLTERADGVYTFRAPLQIRHGYRFPLTRRRWARRIAALAPDLIESGDPYQLAWASLDAAQQLGVPSVGFFHSDLVGAAGLRLGRVGELAASRYARALYRKFDLVLAPSRYAVRRLRDLGVERVVCQPLGVDVRVFHPDRRRDDLRERLGLAADSRVLVFAGRFSREKNIDLLCESVRRLGPGYHLLLIGSGYAPPPQERMIILPFERDPLALAQWIASADVLVHAGDRETFGLVALEAMACGRPVVAVRGGAISELLERGGIVAETPNSRALADAVEAVYRLGPESLGLQARVHVERHFAWDNVLRSLVAHYASLRGTGAADTAPAYATH